MEWVAGAGVTTRAVLRAVSTTRARVEKTEEITILDLDTALQKHTGRRGLVEIEWYQPHCRVIDKHTEKYQRRMEEANGRFYSHGLESTERVAAEFRVPRTPVMLFWWPSTEFLMR